LNTLSLPISSQGTNIGVGRQSGCGGVGRQSGCGFCPTDKLVLYMWDAIV